MPKSNAKRVVKKKEKADGNRGPMLFAINPELSQIFSVAQGDS